MYKSQHHHIELLHYPEDPLCSAHSSVHLCKPVAIADLLIAFQDVISLESQCLSSEVAFFQ